MSSYQNDDHEQEGPVKALPATSVRCSASDGRSRYRSALRFMPQSTITSARNAT